MSDLSLFGIESGLHELFSAWQEAETPEQVEAAEIAIRACAEAEVRKVDNIRRYWRALDALVAAAKHEAATQAERARLIDARRERLKSVVYEVMDQFGIKKLEGQTGSLLLKGNGGKQAVDITDASMVPDEFKIVTMSMTAVQYNRLWEYMHIPTVNAVPSSKSVSVSLSLVSAALEKGDGVPGARLLERGAHVECR